MFIAPYRPSKIAVEASLISLNLYRMNVSWEKPERHPRSYEIKIGNDDNWDYARNVSGVN